MSSPMTSPDPMPHPTPLHVEADSVFHSLCLGCGMCSMACPTHALRPQGYAALIGCGKRMPRLQASLCLHCGACTAVCPSDTMQQPRLRQLTLQIRENPIHTLIFLCRNTLLLAERPVDKGSIPPDMSLLRAFASPALHAVRTPPGARLEVVRCVHRVGSRFMDRLVQSGVRNILLLGCPESQCRYHQSAAERISQPAVLQALYAAYGIETRLETRSLVPQSAAEVQGIVDAFVRESKYV